MPYLPDGTPVDIVLNPLGVPEPHERRPDPRDPPRLGLPRAWAARSARSLDKPKYRSDKREAAQGSLKAIYGDDNDRADLKDMDDGS